MKTERTLWSSSTEELKENSNRLFWSSKDPYRMKATRKKVTGRHSERIERRDNLLLRVNGSTGWLQKRGLWWPREPAPPTVGFMRWQEILPVVWVSLIILGGVGNQKEVYRLFVCPGAR